MSSRFCLLMLATGILMLTGCSIEPEIDWDRLQEYILLTGEIGDFPCDYLPDDRPVYCQRIKVQRLRPIIGLAFDPE